MNNQYILNEIDKAYTKYEAALELLGELTAEDSNDRLRNVYTRFFQCSDDMVRFSVQLIDCVRLNRMAESIKYQVLLLDNIITDEHVDFVALDGLLRDRLTFINLINERLTQHTT